MEFKELDVLERDNKDSKVKVIRNINKILVRDQQEQSPDRLYRTSTLSVSAFQ